MTCTKMDLHNLIKSTYTQITFKMVNYCCCFSKRADSMLDQKKLYNNFFKHVHFSCSDLYLWAEKIQKLRFEIEIGKTSFEIRSHNCLAQKCANV